MLDEDDVWALSPTMQSRSVFVKFSNTKYAYRGWRDLALLIFLLDALLYFDDYGRLTPWI